MRRTKHDSPLPRVGRPILAGDLISRLKRAEVNRLAGLARKCDFETGDIILSPESVPDEILVLKKGQAELVEGKALSAIRKVSDGEVIGLTESIARIPVCAGLRASTDCHFLAIKCSDLEAFLRDDPEACYRSAEIVAGNLRIALKRLADRSP
jgi:CRP-like cAMP-binding protein